MVLLSKVSAVAPWEIRMPTVPLANDESVARATTAPLKISLSVLLIASRRRVPTPDVTTPGALTAKDDQVPFTFLKIWPTKLLPDPTRAPKYMLLSPPMPVVW